jgi:hypothetical protein
LPSMALFQMSTYHSITTHDATVALPIYNILEIRTDKYKVKQDKGKSKARQDQSKN